MEVYTAWTLGEGGAKVIGSAILDRVLKWMAMCWVAWAVFCVHSDEIVSVLLLVMMDFEEVAQPAFSSAFWKLASQGIASSGPHLMLGGSGTGSDVGPSSC